MKTQSFLTKALALLLALAIVPAALVAQTFDEGPELDSSKDYYAAMVTSMGTLKLKLFPDKAPVTVKNFVNLAEGTREFTDPRNGQKAKRPYFNGTVFHRCIQEFMVQGGDPTGTGRGDPGYRFKDEFTDLKFDRPGLLAMANAGPGTNGSQFFITEVPTPHLNNRHTIFGELVDAKAGIEIVNPAIDKKIIRVVFPELSAERRREFTEIVKKMARAPQNSANKPLQAITLERVEIIRVPKGTPTDQVDFGAAAKAAPQAEKAKADAAEGGDAKSAGEKKDE